MTTPLEKGNSLESAVLAIEELILRTSPNVKEKTYLIESKKHINAVGVHHEIDIFVTFELGPGYRPIFIFECKNWLEAVGKNEIIVFAEKITASGAQHGFFIAKSFTADAVAQAQKEPRMELLVVTEHDPAKTILPFGYHTTHANATHIKGVLRKWGAKGKETVPLDISKAIVTLDGKSLNAVDYFNAWVLEAINESMRTFPSGTLAAGIYKRECSAERTFPEGSLRVNDTMIQTARIEVQFDVYLVHPAIKSHFEVGGRGRVISFEAHSAGALNVDTLQFIFGA